MKNVLIIPRHTVGEIALLPPGERNEALWHVLRYAAGAQVSIPKYKKFELAVDNAKKSADGERTDALSDEDYRRIINHLNLVVGSRYTSKSRATRAKIDARIREGYTVEDFIRVIDNKAAAWSKDEKMREYLRPETLFGKKFEGYLNSGMIRSRAEAPAESSFETDSFFKTAMARAYQTSENAGGTDDEDIF